jgi:hypothetical protein
MRQVIGVFLILFAGTVLARPVLWTFDNVTFDDGATLTGSFIYDAAADHYSSINLRTESSRRKGFTSPAVYGHGAVSWGGFNGADLDVSIDAACHDGICRRTLSLNFLYSVPPPPDGSPPSPRSPYLPDAGGTIDLAALEYSDGKRLYSRNVVSGSVTGSVLPFTNIKIDIQPADATNFIDTEGDLDSEITVAILTTNIAEGDAADFDALQVDAASVSFGPGEAQVENVPGTVKDIDGDGDQDLELKFQYLWTFISCEYPDEVALMGQTAAGEAVMGADFVTTPDCPGCHP